MGTGSIWGTDRFFASNWVRNAVQ